MIRVLLTVAIYALIECGYLFAAQYIWGDLSMVKDSSARGGVAFLNVIVLAVLTVIIEIHEAHSQGLRSDWIDMITGKEN